MTPLFDAKVKVRHEFSYRINHTGGNDELKGSVKIVFIDYRFSHVEGLPAPDCWPRSGWALAAHIDALIGRLGARVKAEEDVE